jgi:hypothetical protein
MSEEHGPSLEEMTRARVPYILGLGVAVLVIAVLAALSAVGVVP